MHACMLCNSTSFYPDVPPTCRCMKSNKHDRMRCMSDVRELPVYIDRWDICLDIVEIWSWVWEQVSVMLFSQIDILVVHISQTFETIWSRNQLDLETAAALCLSVV